MHSLPIVQVSQQNHEFQRFYDDIDKFDSISNNPFMKEISIEGDDLEKYSEIQRMTKSQVKENANYNRDSYEQESNYTLRRVIKIKVISELN